MAKGGKGGDGGAGQARQDEQARQAKIRLGTKNINSIFDGGEIERLNPYSGDTSTLANMFARGGQTNKETGEVRYTGEDGKSYAKDASGKYYEVAKETVAPQFNDDFFNKRRDDYLSYASPQLDQQFAEAQKQLAFSLDRSGNLNSSVRAQKEKELQTLYDTNKRGIADQGLSYSNTARSNIEDARSNLVNTLNATGDAEGAANSAIARSRALSAPESYSPLGQLFTQFTSGLGQQAALEKSAALSGGLVKPTYNTGLFGPSKNSVTVQR